MTSLRTGCVWMRSAAPLGLVAGAALLALAWSPPAVAHAGDPADDDGGAAAGAASDPAPGALDGGGRLRAPVVTPGGDPYDVKIRELEEKVVGLKEKIFRTKTRLMLLKERILNDVIAEAKSVIVHVNDMGSSFEPVQVLYHLDGEKIYFQDNETGTLTSDDPIEIYSGNVMPGNHVLSVEMVYRGDSPLFVYLKDYLFKLRANYTFYATKGKITEVRAIGYQKGDITYDITERPSIKFRISQVSYTKQTLEDVAPAAGAE